MLMRAHRCLPVFVFPLLLAGCNTPPIPPGKSVDIPTALEQVLDGLCNFRKQEAARKRDGDVDIDTVTVQLDLTIDGSRNPPVAVAPDIQFIPTVSYGQMITANRGSTLTIALKHKGTGSWGTGDCNASK
jgi:hypothetical protein